jgi:hypothetical protein
MSRAATCIKRRDDSGDEEDSLRSHNGMTTMVVGCRKSYALSQNETAAAWYGPAPCRITDRPIKPFRMFDMSFARAAANRPGRESVGRSARALRKPVPKSPGSSYNRTVGAPDCFLGPAEARIFANASFPVLH